MGNENRPYLQWLLRYNQPRFEFANSYYFAQFCEEFPRIYQERNHKELLLTIIKGLENEEMEGTESDIIRFFVIHLLKLVSETRKYINDGNYNSYLRDFLAPEMGGKTNPLKPGDSFHSLATEVKLYIFSLLMQKSTKRTNSLNHIAIDSEDNKYFLVNGGRLFVQCGRRMEDMAKEECRKNTSPDTVERHLHEMPPVRLLAETREQWVEVSRALINFGEEETGTILCGRLEDVMEEIKPLQLKSMLKKGQAQQQKRPTFSQESIDQDDRRKADKGEGQKRVSNKHLRCQDFPRCYLPNEVCTFSHPMKMCDSPIDCRGLDCPYIHGTCTDDGGCVEAECKFEHYRQDNHKARQIRSEQNGQQYRF